MNKHLGSCLCGEVRFEIVGNFERFFLCHCGRCRKDTGSAHAANLFSSTAKVHWLSAATPTPDDLCAIGDSNADHCYTDATRQVRRDYLLNEKTGHYHEYRAGLDDKTVKDQATKPTGIR